MNNMELLEGNTYLVDKGGKRSEIRVDRNTATSYLISKNSQPPKWVDKKVFHVEHLVIERIDEVNGKKILFG